MNAYAYLDYCSRRIELRFTKQVGPNNSHLIAMQPAVMAPVEEGHYIPAAIVIDNTTAQQLMDQLWQCGLRPTEGTGSAGALAATQQHLEDMRRIVFHKLGEPNATVR